MSGTGVTANCLHPGAVYTNLWRQNIQPGLFSCFQRLVVFAMRFHQITSCHITSLLHVGLLGDGCYVPLMHQKYYFIDLIVDFWILMYYYHWLLVCPSADIIHAESDCAKLCHLPVWVETVSNVSQTAAISRSVHITHPISAHLKLN